MKVCVDDGAPLVSTFEVGGAELHCLKCGAYVGILHCWTVDSPTPEQVRRAQLFVDLFRAGATGPVGGIDEIETPPATEPSDSNIKCGGCGIDSGCTVAEGKPSAWYGRVIDGVSAFACSIPCTRTIGDATNTSRMVMPW